MLAHVQSLPTHHHLPLALPWQDWFKYSFNNLCHLRVANRPEWVDLFFLPRCHCWLSVLVSRSSSLLYYALMRTPSLETWVTDFCSHLLLTCHELRELNLILQASTMISVSHLGPSFVSLIPSPGASCSSNPRKETRVSRPKTIRLLL